jgi:Rieske Fe-S protein
MSETTRRTVLAGAAGAGAAAVLAACGGSDTASPGGATTAGGGTTGPTTGGAPATAGPPAPTTGTGPGSASTALAKTSDVPVGGGVIFVDKEVVVTQPARGTFKGFSSTCQHMGCPVTSVAGGTINCDCHGSRYSIADGSVLIGPATRPLPAKSVKVEGENITLA